MEAKKLQTLFVSHQEVAIQSSYNVDRVVYGGTGVYTIYYTNKLGTTNYAVSGSATKTKDGTSVPRFVAPQNTDALKSDQVTQTGDNIKNAICFY